MALTPEQIIEYRKKYGLPQKGFEQPQAKKPGSFDLSELENAWSGQPEQPKQVLDAETKPKSKFFDKEDFFRDTKTLANIVGGDKLAEGLGLAIAAPGVQKQQEEAQNTLIDQQSKIIKQLHEERAKGLDTTETMGKLRQNQREIMINAGESEEFVNSLPSNKQVLGSSARLATTLAGGSIASGASKVAGTANAVGKVSGAVRGAVAGATAGGVEGAVHGAGIAAEADKPTGELIMSGVLGGVAGAALGGAVGTVAGAVSGSAKAKVISKENFAKELASPKLTAKVETEAIRQGRLESPGLFKKAKITPSSRDAKLGDAINDVVSEDATVSQNIDAIKYKISKTNNGAREYIAANKVPFNKNQLRSSLESGKQDLDLIFASDTTAEKTYNAVSEALVKRVESGDTLGLFDARQDFDQIPAIKKLLDSDKLGENARREIVLSVRKAANEYIGSLLPEGNAYRADMLQEHYMLEALTNVAEKAQQAGIVGHNKLQLLAKEFPFFRVLVGTGLAGLGLGALGVGGAAISSLD